MADISMKFHYGKGLRNRAKHIHNIVDCDNEANVYAN